MRNLNLSSIALLSLLTACSTFSGSGGTASGPSPTTGGPVVQAGTSTRVSGTVSAGSVSVTLSAEQSAAVRAWYGQSGQQVSSNGRGRGGGLPPGIARNLERGKPLPPGIAKQYLPQQLVVDLPRVGNGLEYVVVAGKLLLVEAATQMVRQILMDTLFA